MRVVVTGPARDDLKEIHTFLAIQYPRVLPSVERRIRIALTRISHFPESAHETIERPGVRMVPLVRYPYKIFYRITGNVIDVLHIYHTSRR
jgi:plasmid stabilization system protein ParE